MQQLSTLRTAQRTLSLREWAGVKRNEFRAWLHAESATFTALCGESFTHKEVILTHLFVIGLALACGVAEWLEGGAL